MTIEEWKSFYKRKTGSDFVVRPFETLLHDEKYGLFTFSVCPMGLFIGCEVTNDNSYWKKVTEEICYSLGVKHYFFVTERNTKALNRKYGYKLVGSLMRGDI